MAKNDMLVYWERQIPARPVAIDVRDQNGNQLNLSAYTGFEIVLLGSDDELIDTSGVELLTAGAAQGRFVLRWPTNESLFEKSGDYLLQLVATGSGTRDITTAHPIRVKRLGGTR